MILEAQMQDTLETVLAHKGASVHYVIPETPVLDAVRKMNQERIGALLVCEQGEMVGIFTERDVLIRIVDEGRDPKATRVVDVMTQNVVAVRPDTGVEEAMAIISDRRFRHLPVSRRGRRATGAGRRQRRCQRASSRRDPCRRCACNRVGT